MISQELELTKPYTLHIMGITSNSGCDGIVHVNVQGYFNEIPKEAVWREQTANKGGTTKQKLSSFDRMKVFLFQEGDFYETV